MNPPMTRSATDIVVGARGEVRAHVAAVTMRAAVDLLQDRLRTRLDRVRHHGDGHLFTDARTGLDRVVSRDPASGGHRVDVAVRATAPAPVPAPAGAARSVPDLAVAQAVERLEPSGPPLVFVTDTATARGTVVYHRYDGRYGLITPALWQGAGTARPAVGVRPGRGAGGAGDGWGRPRPHRPAAPHRAGPPYSSTKRVDGRGGPDGEVSTLLHDTVHGGDELTLSAPFGDVALDDSDDPLVLVSAGIGCTPLVGMLEHLAATGSTRPVTVLHADRSPDEHALRARTRELLRQLPDARAEFWYEQPGADEPDAHAGLIDLSGSVLPEDARVYLCGPLPFMREARAQLLRAGIPARSIRYEVFGPDLWLADATA
ncbi:hypothetical protein [Kitasatospora sp. NPDC088346]|uniref:hypothetical protein n=1 Tax=Kitasatospora sp. NPDC088346 TaxID=3364073 RepID=UPI003819C131